jgi:hypothetical protein
MKKLYMAAAAAAPQSTAQQKLILQMAEKASNGKELLLTARAAAGAFPAGTVSQELPLDQSPERGAGSGLGHVEPAIDFQYIRLGDLRQYLLPAHAETLS